MDCFSGTAMVSWLMDAGLAADETEAHTYADGLLTGAVISTCSKQSHSSFRATKHNMYKFCSVST